MKYKLINLTSLIDGSTGMRIDVRIRINSFGEIIERFDYKDYNKSKQWKTDNKKRWNKYMHEYRKENKSYLREIRRIHYYNNKEYILERDREWIEKNKERVRELWRKSGFRRRELGFIALNNPFPKSVAHHINNDAVIYIPEKIHKGFPHNVWTGEGMLEINYLAVMCLEYSKIIDT